MAFRKIIAFVSCLSLIGCAQIGVLTGGDVDTYSPKPLDGKTYPANESTQFQGNSVSIEFDEYFKLNNPIQTISIVPAHVKPQATVVKKTLKIHWEEQLQENTTYVIYLNGTVQDISEGNDSLIYYVFSTGTTLDSIRYQVRVVDAWTNKPVQNALVGLFTHADSTKPFYVAKSTAEGLADFRYLKAGDYHVKAFIDANNDQTLQPFEAVAFNQEVVSLNSSKTDTTPLRLFRPVEEPKVRTTRFQAPGSILVGANIDLRNSKFSLNGSPVESKNMYFFRADSVQLFHAFQNASEATLIIQNNVLSDTSSIRIPEKEKAKSLNITPAKKEMNIGAHEPISFRVNDLISQVDTSKIVLSNASDSSLVPLINYELNAGTLTLYCDRTGLKSLLVEFLPGALNTLNAKSSEPSKFTLTLLQEKDFGVLHVDASAIAGPIIVQLLLNDQLVGAVSLEQNKKHTFDHLLPAEYSFRVIADTNKNGQWDTGELSTELQPELVYWFSDRTKVRANWEVSVKLDPTE